MMDLSNHPTPIQFSILLVVFGGGSTPCLPYCWLPMAPTLAQQPAWFDLASLKRRTGFYTHPLFYLVDHSILPTASA